MNLNLARILALLLCLGILLTLGSKQASAYCVYNDDPYTNGVAGESCARCFDKVIRPHGKGCCPGNAKGCRGKTWISVIDGSERCRRGPLKIIQDYRYWYCGKRVEAHGWVTIKSHHCTVKNAKGHITWQGKMKKTSCGVKDD